MRIFSRQKIRARCLFSNIIIYNFIICFTNSVVNDPQKVFVYKKLFLNARTLKILRNHDAVIV